MNVIQLLSLFFFFSHRSTVLLFSNTFDQFLHIMSLIVNFYQFNVDWFLYLSIRYRFWLFIFIIIDCWLNFEAHFRSSVV